MKTFQHNLFALILLGPMALASIAAEQDSALTILQEDPIFADYHKEQKIAFSTFGAGMAEAFRSSAKNPTVTESEYAIRWNQVSPGYSIEWIAKKGEANKPFPENMKLTQVGTLLSGEIIVGKSTPAEVVRLLGKPITMVDDRISYYLPNYLGDDVATFTFHKGVLTEVLWQWFID